MRIPVAEIPRFPGAGSSSRGQSDPKARPKGVVDGHRVNIPELLERVLPMESAEDRATRVIGFPSKRVGRGRGKPLPH